MKMIVAVALALVAVAAAAPAAPGPDAAVAQVLRSTFEQKPDGGYNFDFESDDAIKRQETGDLKEVLNEENKPIPVITVRGSYSYPDEDGKPVLVTYYADENGYHAEGDSIPKARR